MEFPQVDGAAPADSPLGLLERGRGAGWTHAAGSESGSDLLLACLIREPRWDRQVESRGDFYATLALRLDVPVTALASVAVDDENRWIVEEVLDAMARRGATEAARLLRRMERYEELADAPFPSHDPTVARRAPVSANAPIEYLLAAEWHWTLPKAVAHQLRVTSDPRGLDALREAARDSGAPGWRLALDVLGLLGDSAPLELVEQILARDESGSRRACAFQYMRSLPAEVSLPTARTWLQHDDGRSSAAAVVMGNHAEPADAPAVRTALACADDYYSICALVEALGRLPEAGPFPELEEVYVGSGYSYARARAVRAMAATDPDFAEKWARECLWDCEGVVRVHGAKAVRVDSGVEERLRDLAGDPHEVAEVREAAAIRLGPRAAT